MAEKNSSKNNFIAQAGILAAAGIISRVIGLLYKSPMHAVIGDLGLGYYQIAYPYYTIILLISSYSIPSAISKVIAQKLAVREYRNAHRIFLCALCYVLAVGGVASLFLFFGAGLFVSEEIVPVLRTFAGQFPCSGCWRPRFFSMAFWGCSGDTSRPTGVWRRPPSRRFWSRLPTRLSP